MTHGHHTRQPGPPAVPPDVPGTDLCPDPLAARTPADLAHTLRTYWTWAGRPSYRLMARRTRHRYAPSTLHAALHGDVLPGFGKIQAIITGCHGTTAHHQAFATAWCALHLQSATPDTSEPRQ